MLQEKEKKTHLKRTIEQTNKQTNKQTNLLITTLLVCICKVKIYHEEKVRAEQMQPKTSHYIKKGQKIRFIRIIQMNRNRIPFKSGQILFKLVIIYISTEQ